MEQLTLYLEDPAMATTALTLTHLEREQRAREVNHALAMVRIEGHEPDVEVTTLSQRYVDGDLTSDQLDEALDRFFVGKYGPVPLPRN